MPGKKKRFIDKKRAVTFTLVHRSQKDPEAANEEAPQRVFLSSQRDEQLKYGIDFDDDYNYLQHLKDVDELYQVEPGTFRIGKRSSDVLMEAPIEDKPKLLLPSSVFGSTTETTIGLLNKAAPLSGPHPELDPDILAALDGEVGSDEEMDDDFIAKANSDDVIEEDNEDDYISDDDDDTLESEGDDNNNDVSDSKVLTNKNIDHFFKNLSKHKYNNDNNKGNDADNDDENDDDDDDVRGGRSDDDDDDDDMDDAISRFTGCSMTSSVIRRNDNLKMIDEKFEKFYKQFKKDEEDDDDDDDVGDGEFDASDDGHPMSDAFKHLVDQFTDVSKQKVIKMKDFVENIKNTSSSMNKSPDDDNDVDDDNEDVDDDDEDDDDEDEEEEEEEIMVEKPSKDWDCESILSTYSTTSNLPKTITIPKTAKIKLTKRAQIPADILPSVEYSKRKDEQNHQKHTKPLVLERDKEESREEKKARKNAIKENKRIRRMEKAAMREHFKDEKSRIKKQFLNQQQNFQGASVLS